VRIEEIKEVLEDCSRLLFYHSTIKNIIRLDRKERSLELDSSQVLRVLFSEPLALEHFDFEHAVLVFC
jgi:hypothetical protein